jgi:hypothetical protein
VAGKDMPGQRNFWIKNTLLKMILEPYVGTKTLVGCDHQPSGLNTLSNNYTVGFVKRQEFSER